MILYLVGGIFLIMGLIFKCFPPKVINSVYGYRTSFSMKTQETWDEAQRYSALSFIFCGAALLLAAVLCTLLRLDMLPQTVFFAIGIIIMLVVDEYHLRRMFNPDGTKKE